MTRIRFVTRFVIAALTIVASAVVAQQNAPALSGSFSISPLRLDLAQSSEFTNLTLTNALDRRSSIQIRIFAWRQENGKDIYAPTTDFIASPSIFTMPAGAQQQIHVIRAQPMPDAREQHYRVVVDQLPEAAQGKNQAAATRLQLTLPLFVGSERAQPSRLSAALNGAQLTITNSGGRTARIGTLALLGNNGRRWPINLENGRYVQGQSMLTFDLPGFDCVQAGTLRVAGIVDRAAFDVQPQTRCP